MSTASIKKIFKGFLSLLYPILVGIILGYIIFTFVWIPTESMEPTLRKNSLAISWALPYRFGDPEPERGDIVLFSQCEHNKLLVKRVIAIGGDTVVITEGTVYLNGDALDEPYLKMPKSTLSDTVEFNIPDGCFFALGDNRLQSADSRFWKYPYTPYENINSKILLLH